VQETDKMDEALDQSQKAAEPIETISPGELSRRLKEPGVEVVDTGTQGENRQHAAGEIASIFRLKGDSDFQWFVTQFIDPEYDKAFAALRNPAMRQKDETLETVQARYMALREVKIGMMERELAHRSLLDPNDQEVFRLRKEIDRL
jgi:hypothetical protein